MWKYIALCMWTVLIYLWYENNPAMLVVGYAVMLAVMLPFFMPWGWLLSIPYVDVETRCLRPEKVDAFLEENPEFMREEELIAWAKRTGERADMVVEMVENQLAKEKAAAPRTVPLCRVRKFRPGFSTKGPG